MLQPSVERGIRPDIKPSAPLLVKVAGIFGGALAFSQVLAGCASPKEAQNIVCDQNAFAKQNGVEYYAGQGGGAELPAKIVPINDVLKDCVRPLSAQEKDDYTQYVNAAKTNANSTAVAGGLPNNKVPEATKTPPTPEAVKKGNGAIMPAELSITGVMRDFEYQGQTYKLALYNLPDGTPITAPKDDYFVAGNANKPFIGSNLAVFNPVDLKIPNIGLRGSLNPVSKLSRDVKAGEVIAYIQDTGEKMFGEYNFGVIITTESPTGKGFISPEAPYKEYLPDLPKGERITQIQTIQPTSGNVYLAR